MVKDIYPPRDEELRVSEMDMKRSIAASRRSNQSPVRIGPSEDRIDELHKTQ